MKPLDHPEAFAEAKEIATIYGDLIHDDTAGFIALFNHEIVRTMPEAQVFETRDADGKQTLHLKGNYLLPAGVPTWAVAPDLTIIGQSRNLDAPGFRWL